MTSFRPSMDVAETFGAVAHGERAVIEDRSGAGSDDHADRCVCPPDPPQLTDPTAATRLLAMVTSLARSRYGIHAVDAEDIFQDSAVTYLVVRSRYPEDANRVGLFMGIFRRKALAFLKASRRRGRRFERFATQAVRDRGAPPAEEPIERMETADAIRESISRLSENIRRPMLALAEGRRGRSELIAELGINRNTFDSRLHKARARLRQDLARRGAF